MENIFNYQSVPRHYAHCFNRQCVRSRECLRHLVATNSTAQQDVLTVVNPNRIPSDTSTCPYFRAIEIVRLAWGVKYIFDDVPHKAAKAMRKQIIAHFGKATYYRFYRRERALTPEDQQYIHRVFKQHGIIHEPRFETYTDEIDFLPG